MNTTEKSNSPEPALKSGFVTLVGRSNVGKSTLLNTLVGTKIAAVTEKAQTTRDIIHGVLNDPRGQAVFVDTPGVLKLRKNILAGKLTKRVRESLEDIDLIVYVVDPTRSMGEEERFTLSLIRKLDLPKILVINKSDLPEKNKPHLEDYRDLASDFTDVFELSALKAKHIKPLQDKVFELLPAGQPMYEGDQITNINKEKWVSEIIREKIFHQLRQEAPYSTHVEVESIEDKPDIVVIKAIIYTYDSRYRRMIVGAGGRAIKAIGSAARKELEAAFNKKVFLELEVETDKHWERKV